MAVPVTAAPASPAPPSRPLVARAIAAAALAAACSSTPGPTVTGPGPAATYVPQPVFCAGATPTGSPLCAIIPGNIGPDPALNQTVAYNGINGQLPTSAQTDVQTPFDNLSWQTFVALNWTAGKQSEPALSGLRSAGPRVWETYPRVNTLFGNAPVRGNCPVGPTTRVFEIGSDGQGNPDGHNEEYIQAATGAPLIDVGGNWTIYERRVNGVEQAFLRAPGGKPAQTLTTIAGQNAFVAAGNRVAFPAMTTAGTTGAIEIKAAWRVLDPKDHAANALRFYVVDAMLTVAPDLVNPPGRPICAAVELGLVAMHIIQRNPDAHNALKPEWFWSTFEHVDNAPLAAQACPANEPFNCPLLGQVACPTTPPAGPYSYFDLACPSCTTNQAPQSASGVFTWNPAPPYAKAYLTAGRFGTQVSRCWQVYALTSALNDRWRKELRAVSSVFQNYFLVGTQWGASTTNTPDPKVPNNGVPAFLSNSVVETYLQTLNDPKNPFGTGSCVGCHLAATLAVSNATADLSFLPGLAQPTVLRRPHR